MGAMDFAERLTGNQPQPQKARREIALDEMFDALFRRKVNLLHHVVWIDPSPNLVIKSKMNDLPNSGPMNREDGAEHRRVPVLQSRFQITVHSISHSIQGPFAKNFEIFKDAQ